MFVPVLKLGIGTRDMRCAFSAFVQHLLFGHELKLIEGTEAPCRSLVNLVTLVLQTDGWCPSVRPGKGWGKCAPEMGHSCGWGLLQAQGGVIPPARPQGLGRTGCLDKMISNHTLNIHHL